MCRRFKVRGRVQGVFFRKSAQAAALKLGLSGWVRNLDDGRVESLACGDKNLTNEYLAWLRVGPTLAKVTEVEELSHPCERPKGFDII